METWKMNESQSLEQVTRRWPTDIFHIFTNGQIATINVRRRNGKIVLDEHFGLISENLIREPFGGTDCAFLVYYCAILL